jgi:nucleotide-binding universal stress UspA family protein
MKPIKRVLVAVDFSECSWLALARADELAKALGAELDLLHVWQAPAFVSPEAMVGVTPREQTLGQLVHRESEKALDDFVARAKSAGFSIGSARLVDGEPARTIVEEAERGDYDLIAIGTHGRTGLSHLLLGSVAEKVVRKASRPVISVRETPAR